MTLKAAMKEKTAMKRAIATTVFVGALVLMLAMCARAAQPRCAHKDCGCGK